MSGSGTKWKSSGNMLVDELKIQKEINKKGETKMATTEAHGVLQAALPSC
jgi:hypothetical protein